MSGVSLGPDRVDMSTDAARSAVAALTDELLEDFEQSGGVEATAAAERRAELRGEPAEAPTAPAAAQGQAEEPAAADEPAEEPFDFNPALPTDVAELLDEPDFDAEADAELAAQAEPGEDEYGYDDDERVMAERRARIKAEKRAQHFENLRAKDQAKAWAAEAQQYFPLAEHAIPGIAASSRKQFLREAKAAHDAIYPHVQKYLNRAQKVVQAERGVARDEERAAVQQAWGRPTTGPGVAPAQQADATAALERARQSGSLEEVYREMLNQGM